MMELSQFLISHGIPFEENINLSSKTWIKTGGLCLYWVTPKSIDDLTEVCRYLYQNNISFDVVGQTSNLFFHSTYNPEVVISTVKVNNYCIKDDVLICECGVSVIKLAKACLADGYLGFYGLIGLPGTVASAIVNNSSCFDCSVSSMIISSEVLMPDGSISILKKEHFCYTNRSSIFKRKEKLGVILSVKLQLKKAADLDSELQKSEYCKKYRKENQEGMKNNLGSVFSEFKRKQSIKIRVSALIAKLAESFHIANRKRIFKILLLYLYGYMDLDKYISNKHLNTFVWYDSKAEQKFVRYKEFMNQIYEIQGVEIEERV